MKSLIGIVLGLMLAASLAGCASEPTKPDSSTVDFGLALSTPGLNVPPVGQPVDVSGVTKGALKSVQLLARTETSIRVRFKCNDGTEHDVDVPLPVGGKPGPFVETGCTSGGKPVRLNLKP
jgi:hypothetical protein